MLTHSLTHFITLLSHVTYCDFICVLSDVIINIYEWMNVNWWWAEPDDKTVISLHTADMYRMCQRPTDKSDISSCVNVVRQSIERGPCNLRRSIELITSHDSLHGCIAGIKPGHRTSLGTPTSQTANTQTHSYLSITLNHCFLICVSYSSVLNITK